MVFMLSSIALFVLLSRTSLYLFILTGLVLLFRTHPFKMLIYTLILFVACFIVIDFDILQFKNDRMLRFLFTGKDSSWSHRGRLLTEGYNHLYNHWVLGEFMWEVKKNGGQTGGYIHNLLSIMNQFGVIPFLIIIVSILVAYLKIGFSFIFRGKESTYFLFTIASFSFFAIIFSRSYQVPYFWLSLTAVFTYFKQNYDKRTSVHFNASKK